jgi:5-methylcytosine-specific restriction endonuclease McrA
MKTTRISPHHVDHVISRKHGGASESSNLAYACFHPRLQRWEDHVVLRGAVIEPLTDEGEATARLLKLNLDKLVAERQILTATGRYPR